MDKNSNWNEGVWFRSFWVIVHCLIGNIGGLPDETKKSDTGTNFLVPRFDFVIVNHLLLV